MAWQDLSELAPQLSEGDMRFEKGKRVVGLFLGPLCFVLALILPEWSHVSPLGMRTLGIFSWAVVWWITEAIPIPVTALMILPLLVLCGILPLQKAFGYWSHWAVLFLFGAFVIGYVMQKYGLLRRFSLHLIASRLVGGSPWRLLVFFLLANTIITGFLSNAVTAVLFLSMGLGLLEIMKVKPGSGYGMAMFLGIAWATNIGATITPGGTPTNLIAIALVAPLHYQIGYAQWFVGTFPFTVVQTIAMFVVLRFYLRRDELTQDVPQAAIQDELKKLGPFSRGEKVATAALVIAIFLWVLPEMSSLVLGREHPIAVLINARLNWGLVGVLVAVALFLVPIDWKSRQFTLTWSEAAQNIDWGTMALIAGALAIGETVSDKEVGLGQFFSAAVSAIAGPQASRYVFLLGTITLSVILTNMATNIAIISFLGPIALTVAPTVGLNPIALTVVVSLSSCIGYSLPSANPPCAIVFASGYVRILPMLIRGMILSLLGILLLSFVGYPVADWAFPFTAVSR
ncbi:MAG: anion permease [Acidobacteria bacterium]|nr:anion permease [Acidobacteriota bacterium]